MHRLTFFTVGLALILSDGISQNPYLQEYQLLKGRESLEIKSLLQDADGYIWIGTNKGLFRFDGINKIQFTSANGLPENLVSALAVDSLGRIWSGHRNGKISYLGGDRFVEFTTEEGSAVAEISKIHFDNRGTLWFSTLNDGIYYYKKNR